MANPQPDIFFKWSKELWKAVIRWKFPPRSRQVFDALAYLTYGQVPPVKERQISGKMLMELTGHNKNQTTKALHQLISMNIVAKNGNYYPASMRINKDYETWKQLPKTATPRKQRVSEKVPKKLLPKTATIVAKNGNNPDLHLISSKKENLAIALYNFYKTEINPLKKVRHSSIKNISHYLKFHSHEDLKKSIQNYKVESDKNEPRYRKSCSNFFGRSGESEKYFEDYLPNNFTTPVESSEGIWAVDL